VQALHQRQVIAEGFAIPFTSGTVLQPVLQPAVEAPILGSRAIRWPDEAACATCAGHLARHAALKNASVELHGPLGAGKTTFVRHLLRALGVEGRIKSPTYTVMEPYALPGLVISHFDFYRFNDPREWLDAGFRDAYAAPGLKLAEWPEKAAGMLPVADLQVHIDIDEDQPGARQVRLLAGTPLGLELLG
jgi:tRNA threonylcarbamoyladenosine biosynthesis protein TsaE